MSAARHVAALTGLRGIAVSLVVLAHMHLRGFEAGVFGVDLFFVLSGFLITHALRSLAADRATPLRQRLSTFLGRRAARLLPALGVTLVGLTAWVLATGQGGACLALAATHGMNLPVAGAASCPGPLHVTWSLAAEEQFYLVWPLAVLGLARLAPQRAAAACIGLYGGLAALSLAVAHVSPDTAGWWNYAPMGRPSALLLGSGLAFLISLHPRSRGAAVTPYALPLLGAGLVGAAVLTEAGSRQVALGPLVAVPAVLLVAVLVRSPWSRAARLCRARALLWLGEISYALYLVHALALRVVRDALGSDRWWANSLGAVVAVLLAWGLHRLVEEPARRRGYAWLAARAARRDDAVRLAA